MLERSAGTPSSPRPPWYARHACGAGALAVGLVALTAAFMMQFGGDREIDEIPDLRVTAPLLLCALGLAIAAWVRRESAAARNMGVVGVGMAGAALALGWVVVAALVAAAALLVIALIAKFT